MITYTMSLFVAVPSISTQLPAEFKLIATTSVKKKERRLATIPFITWNKLNNALVLLTLNWDWNK